MEEEEKTNSTSGYTSTTAVVKDCPACEGTGLQTRNDGIKIVCPVCDGTGNWVKQTYNPHGPNNYERKEWVLPY